jgi:hypothetical protein
MFEVVNDHYLKFKHNFCCEQQLLLLLIDGQIFFR